MNRTLVIQNIAASATLLKAAAAIAGAGDLTLLVSTLDTNPIGRKLLITSAGDDRTIYFVIDYKDAGSGALRQEILFGSNGTTAVSTNYMREIVNIWASGASAGNVSIGTTATGGYVSLTDPIYSPRKPINVGIQAHLVGNIVKTTDNDAYLCLVSHTSSATNHPSSKQGSYYWKYLGKIANMPAWVTSTSYVSTNSGISYKVQYTLDDMLMNDSEKVWFDSSEGAQTADYYFNFGFPVSAVRVMATVITTGGIIINVEKTC